MRSTQACVLASQRITPGAAGAEGATYDHTTCKSTASISEHRVLISTKKDSARNAALPGDLLLLQRPVLDILMINREGGEESTEPGGLKRKDSALLVPADACYHDGACRKPIDERIPRRRRAPHRCEHRSQHVCHTILRSSMRSRQLLIKRAIGFACRVPSPLLVLPAVCPPLLVLPCRRLGPPWPRCLLRPR